jgi:hypothetical protein
MPTRRELLVLAAMGAGAPAAFAQEFRMPRVELDFDPAAKFATFKTYRWKDGPFTGDNPKAQASIVWYTERDLEAKGLRKVAEGPVDLLVRYYAKASKSLKGIPAQGESILPGGNGSLTTSVDFQQVAEGTMILELYRASDEKLVWRAGTTWGAFDPDQLDSEVERAVRLLLTKYPPPPKAATP